jgi:hypothetical protein
MSDPNTNMPPPYPPPPGTGTPPNPGYPPPPGYAPPGAGAPPQQNLTAMAQTFVQNARRVITQPNIPSFDTVHASANWNSVLLSLAALAVVRGLTSAIHIGPAQVIHGVRVTYNPVADIIGGIVVTFISFFIGTGILQLVARAFKGTGSFLTYAHALALVVVPIGIAGAVLGLIPFLGGLIAFALGIYEIYLAIVATASTHRLSMGTSTAVVLIPAAVVFVVVIILTVAAAAVLYGLGYHL